MAHRKMVFLNKSETEINKHSNYDDSNNKFKQNTIIYISKTFKCNIVYII